MTRLAVDDLIIDTDLRAVSRADDPLDIGGLTYDLLLALVEAAPAALDHDSLTRAVWPGRVVTPETLSQRVRLLRKSLNDDAEQPHYVASIRGFGYRLLPQPVELAPTLPAIELIEFGTPPPTSMRAGAARHTIAVLPIAVPNDDPDLSMTALGMHQDLIGHLARARAFPVTAQASTLRFAQADLDPTETANALGARFLVCSNLIPDGRTIRLVLTLTDGSNGTTIWQQDYPVATSDVISISRTLYDDVVGQLELELIQLAQQESLRMTDNLDAWTAYHRGCWHMYWFNELALQRAQFWFEKARQLDPGAARPWACLSWVAWQRVFLGLTDDPQTTIQSVRDLAEQSLARDRKDPMSHWALGRALLLERKTQAAATVLERAVTLNPSFAVGRYSLAFAQLQSGSVKQSIEHSNHAAHISPYDPLLSLMLTTTAFGLTLQGARDEGADAMRHALAQPNVHFAIHAKAAVTFALANAMPEAQEQLTIVRESHSEFDIEQFKDTFQYSDPAVLALFEEAFDRLRFTANQ